MDSVEEARGRELMDECNIGFLPDLSQCEQSDAGVQWIGGEDQGRGEVLEATLVQCSTYFMPQMPDAGVQWASGGGQ